MPYDINAALERLEKNLSEVESAKSQVKETVATSENLQKIINNYCESLKSLNSEISTFVSEVNVFHSHQTATLDSAITKTKTTCDEVINKFSSDVKMSTDKFDETIAESIKAIDSENSKLTEQVDRMNSLYKSLINTANTVKDIEQKLDSISKELKVAKGENEQTLSTLKTAISRLASFIKSQIDSVHAAINTKSIDIITKADEKTIIICNQIKADISNLESIIDSYNRGLHKALNTNRWITIGGIIILIILHFIHL